MPKLPALKLPALKRFSRYKPRKGLAGLWTEERAFLQAAKEIRKQAGKNMASLSPYPVHGLEEAMETPRSWIPWVTLVFGLGGCLFGLWFTWWTSVVDWPVIVGGKPHWSLTAFIPIIFELTILFAALSSIAALIYACGLPHISPPVIDPALSSHKFAIFVPLAEPEKRGKLSAAQIRKLFEELKAKEILETEF